MINPIIKEQLDSLSGVDITQTSEYEYDISPKTKQTVELSGYYIIALKSYITNPPDNFTLSDNWNRGIIPKSKYIKCFVKQILGKMIKIDGNGFDMNNKIDLQDYYSDIWLPQEGFEIICKLN